MTPLDPTVHRIHCKETIVPFELPPLPFAEDALAPVMSAETLSFHYGKHHAAYVNNLNNLLKDTAKAEQPLEQVIMEAEPGGVFNNSAQIWNHTFFWSSLSPSGGGDPSGALRSAIESSFGSVDDFKQQFADKAKTLFGSGWTWLVKDGDGLAIVQTANADLPMKHGQQALLTLDVWEHAYYIDYRNARPAFVDAFIEKLVNWEFAGQNFGA